MNEQSGSKLKKLRRLLVHPGTWIPGTIGLLIIIVLIALPYGIRYGIKRGLTEAGAQQVLIEDVDFNPFIGRLALRGLQVQVDGKRTLLLPQATVRYALWSLFQRRVMIDDLHVRGASFTVEQSADGRWRFIGLAAHTPPATPEKAPGKETAWEFELRHATVLDSEVQYTSAKLSGTAQIDNGELTSVPEAGSQTDSTTDSTHVNLNGHLRVQHTQPGVTAETQISANITAAPPADGAGAWRITGNGQLRDIAVNWPDGKLHVASAERLSVEGLSVAGASRIVIADLGVDGLHVAQSTTSDSAPAVSVGQLHATEIRLVPEQTLDIAGISVRGLRVTARHEASGSWYGFAPLHELASTFPAPAEAKPGLAVHIGRIATEDPGVIELSDAAIKPEFHTRITLDSVRLTGLDTGTPPAQPAKLSLSARAGKYATIELNGRFDALRPAISANLEAKTRQIDMQALSAYSAKMFGYRIVSGQLNSDLRLRIAQGRLEGNNKIMLANLSVTPKDEAAVEQMKTRLTMPLDSALDMLRDKDNNVHLETHLSGDMSDPQFSLTDAINQALTHALQTASVSYLKYFFQPYGTLITVAELAGKALQMRLDPVPFPAAKATPAPATRDYIEKVGKLLQKRTKLRLKLCGKTVPRDGLSGDAALALATKRAEGLKDYFVKQYGIASDRLFLCDPELDKGADAQPRVDLTL